MSSTQEIKPSDHIVSILGEHIELFNRFCGESSIYEHSKPFIGEDGRIYATNGHVAIRTREQYVIEQLPECVAKFPPADKLNWQPCISVNKIDELPVPPTQEGDRCPSCNGMGTYNHCPECDGDGGYFDKRDTWHQCSACNGNRYISGNDYACVDCEGAGRLSQVAIVILDDDLMLNEAYLRLVCSPEFASWHTVDTLSGVPILLAQGERFEALVMSMCPEYLQRNINNGSPYFTIADGWKIEGETR